MCVVTSVLVVLGWVSFLVDQAQDATTATASEIRGRAATQAADPSPDAERAREAIHARPRELVDDANDLLLAPFAWLSDGSSSKWMRRTVPAAAALLVYGFGLATLARVVGGTDLAP